MARHAVIPELNRQATADDLSPITREYLTEVGQEFIKQGREIVTSKTTRRSGDLVDGFGFEIHGSGDNLDVELYNDADHARYQDEGTGVHGPKGTPIRPKRKKVLAFEINGEMVFAREVQGAPAINFMNPAAERAVDLVNRRYQ